MNLRGELIHIGIWLRKQNSECRYADYYNVLKKKFPGKLTWLMAKDWKRHMRKLKDRGTFYGGDGIFIINNQLFERMGK